MRPLVLAVVLLLVPFVSANIPQGHGKLGQRQGREGKVGRRRGRNRKCGEWTLTDCIPVSGTCGAGTQEATRDGSCNIKQKTLDCVVPCLGESEEGTLVLENPDPTIDIDGGPAPTPQEPTKEDKKTRRREKKNKRKAKMANKGCRYRRDTCQECDVTTNQKICTMSLKKGGESCELTKTVTRICNKKRNKDGCKYTRPKRSNSTWSECDPVTRTKSITVALKRGDPDTCAPTKVISRNCRSKRAKKACRYQKGKWQSCNSESRTKSRVDSLREGSDDTCEATRTIEKPCKRIGKRCLYDFGNWSECVEGKRERTATLKPRSKTGCPPTKVLSKSCTLRDGSERCFYGPWGEFSDCHNGVKTKIRPVLFGGADCLRRGVKTRPCK
jgi:hypothetical protein